MIKVCIDKCSNYDEKIVKESIYRCLNEINSIKDKLKPGTSILIKPNLLKRNKPEDCVTTHPSVVKAVAEYLMEHGCKVIIGDSPAGPLNKKLLEGIYRATGMESVANSLGCELFNSIEYDEVSNSKALMLKKMQVISAVQKVDYVVSVAKLKTHCMMTYSGAVKNLFGVIPGLIKAEYHWKLNDEENFANHLVDICEYVNPLFTVIDAIDGMEGDGPSNGDKKHVGLILASENPYALDSAAVRLIGIDSQKVPTITVAKKRGIWSDLEEELEFPLFNLSNAKQSNFKLPESVKVNFLSSRVPKVIEERVVKTLKSKPQFLYDKCKSCGDCQRICPAQIIKMEAGKPYPDLSKCISCFCCHEVCPHDAVRIKKHWLYNLFYR